MRKLLLVLCVSVCGSSATNGGEADLADTVDFDSQVIPVLTKAGCNSGACHGAAVGRGGFRLSLYGSRPQFDYESIAWELEGRRINRWRPEDSLLLQKPTGWKDHGGDIRLDEDQAGYAILKQWIAQGARRQHQRTLSDFQVTASAHVLDAPHQSVQLKAVAAFDDETRQNATDLQDVTDFTVFTAEDETAVQISPLATATVTRPGRHLIIARYLNRVIPVELIVPLARSSTAFNEHQPANVIDEFIERKLKVLNLPLSGQVDDAGFVRRVCLDLTGRLPTLEQLHAFRNNTHADRRQQLVDQLLQSDAFVEFWTWRFAQLLRIRSNPDATAGITTYHTWLHKQLADAVPYNRIVRQLLLAEGDIQQYGPANFYNSVADARAQAEFVSELFLGVRLRCANCHDHPLDQWTQDDYHGLSAIFARMDRGLVIRERSSGSVIHPATGEHAVARIPGERFLETPADARLQLTDWMLDDQNPYFAKAIVNRMWKWLMGRGLVDPVDDLRVTNPATHPQLLQQLADDFVASGYQLRHIMRQICVSQAYARSAATTPHNASDDRYYSHALIRPLQAEVLLDAICDVTAVPDSFAGQPQGTRAVSLINGATPSEALDILGRCDRQESCESDFTDSGGMSQKLHLMNGSLLNDRITAAEGRLHQMLQQGTDADQIVSRFYLLALSRPATTDEQNYWHSQFAAVNADADKVQLAEDFLWSLLTCREFTTNH